MQWQINGSCTDLVGRPVGRKYQRDGALSGYWPQKARESRFLLQKNGHWDCHARPAPLLFLFPCSISSDGLRRRRVYHIMFYSKAASLALAFSLSAVPADPFWSPCCRTLWRLCSGFRDRSFCGSCRLFLVEVCRMPQTHAQSTHFLDLSPFKQAWFHRFYFPNEPSCEVGRGRVHLPSSACATSRRLGDTST